MKTEKIEPAYETVKRANKIYDIGHIALESFIVNYAKSKEYQKQMEKLIGLFGAEYLDRFSLKLIQGEIPTEIDLSTKAFRFDLGVHTFEPYEETGPKGKSSLVSVVRWVLDKDGNVFLSPLEIKELDLDDLMNKHNYEVTELKTFEKKVIRDIYERTKLVHKELPQDKLAHGLWGKLVSETQNYFKKLLKQTNVNSIVKCSFSITLVSPRLSDNDKYYVEIEPRLPKDCYPADSKISFKGESWDDQNVAVKLMTAEIMEERIFLPATQGDKDE